MKIDTIYPGLHVRGEFRKLELQQKLAELAHIDIVVCLIHTNDPELLRQPSLDYFTWPIPDGNTVPVTEATRIATYVAKSIETGQQVLVHCRSGRNRSGLVTGLVLQQLTHWPGDTIVTYMRSIRPQFLANPVYEEYVRSL